MQQPQKFNPELFKQVFAANLDMMVNRLNKNVFEKAITIGNPLMTEDEMRELARDYFTKELARTLHERL